MTKVSFYFSDDYEIHIDANQVKFIGLLSQTDFEDWVYLCIKEGLPIAYKGALGEFRCINTREISMIEVKHS